jgi:hypothetical protein
MARLAAELRRVHVLDAAIRRQRHDDDVGHRQREDDDRGAAVNRIVQVELWPPHLGRRPAARTATALDPPTKRNQRQAEQKDARQNQEEQDAEVRVRMEPEEIGEEDDDEDDSADRRQHHAANGDRAANETNGAGGHG